MIPRPAQIRSLRGIAGHSFRRYRYVVRTGTRQHVLLFAAGVLISPAILVISGKAGAWILNSASLGEWVTSSAGLTSIVLLAIFVHSWFFLLDTEPLLAIGHKGIRIGGAQISWASISLITVTHPGDEDVSSAVSDIDIWLWSVPDTPQALLERTHLPPPVHLEGAIPSSLLDHDRLTTAVQMFAPSTVELRIFTPHPSPIIIAH